MNNIMLKGIIKMIGPEEIKNIFSQFTKVIFEKKNNISLEAGEVDSVLIIFEKDSQVWATIGTINQENKILRQIETFLIEDYILKTLNNA